MIIIQRSRLGQDFRGRDRPYRFLVVFSSAFFGCLAVSSLVGRLSLLHGNGECLAPSLLGLCWSRAQRAHAGLSCRLRSFWGLGQATWVRGACASTSVVRASASERHKRARNRARPKAVPLCGCVGECDGNARRDGRASARGKRGRCGDCGRSDHGSHSPSLERYWRWRLCARVECR